MVIFRKKAMGCEAMTRMMHTLRRQLALFLALALLLPCLPLSALAEPQVSMLTSLEGDTVPVGEQIRFTLDGIDTAAVKLMIVTPDSKQEFRDGPECTYTPVKPGLYVFIAYGTSTTEHTSPEYALCMSPMVMVTAVGEELPGTDTVMGEAPVQGTVTPPGTPSAVPTVTPTLAPMTGEIELFLQKDDGSWTPLNGEYVYDFGHALRADVTGMNIPADAVLSVRLICQGTEYQLLREKIGLYHSRSMWASQALAYVAGNRYGLFTVRAEAILTAPDGQTLEGEATFTLDAYSNQMRYVNRFFDKQWRYGYSDEGNKLQNWLDMNKRTRHRTNSGYLLLEQEMEYHAGKGFDFGNKLAKVLQGTMEIVGSYGISLAIDAWTNSKYKEKFPESGKKAYPYYSNLSSLYADYVTQLVKETEAVQVGASVLEDISYGMSYWDVSANVTDAAGGSIGASEGGVIMMLEKKSADFIYLGSTASGGTALELSITGFQYERGVPMLTWEMAGGGKGKAPLDYFLTTALEGDSYCLRTEGMAGQITGGEDLAYMLRQKLGLGFRYTTDTVAPAGGGADVRAVETHGTVQWDQTGRMTFRTDVLNRTLNVEAVDELGLYKYLSPDEQFYVDKFKGYVKQDTAGKTPIKGVKWAAYGLSAATTGLEWINYAGSLAVQDDLQRAYFNAYASVSYDYCKALEEWRDSLDGSDVPNAEHIQCALDALIADILLAQDESLENARDAINRQISFNKGVLTSEQLVEATWDTVMLIKDFPALEPFLKKINSYLAQKAAGGINSLRAIAGNAAGNAAASGGAIVSNIAGFLKSAKSFTGPMQIGSILGGIITARYFSFDDSVKSTYYTKWALLESIERQLESYGKNPTHEGAVNIISSLTLMKAAKLQGENLIAAYYLADFFQDNYLTGAASQLILWNEMNSRSGNSPLNFSEYVVQVNVVFQDVNLGWVSDLKEQEVDFTELGVFELESTSAALGQEIQGIYLYGDRSWGTYNGVALQPTPEQFKGNGIKTDRHAAVPVSGDYAFASLAPTERENWQTRPPKPINDHLYKERRFLYSRDGLELLLTPEQYEEYKYGEEKINKILATYDDSMDFEWYEFKEKDEQQYYQRLVWLGLTRKYIESFHMYDQNVSYR